MIQLLQAVGQLAMQIYQANPSLTLAMLSRLGQSYHRLSAAEKEKINGIVRWGGKMLARHALPEILGDVGQQAVAAIGNEQAGEIAKALLTRGAEIGIERALEEADRH